MNFVRSHADEKSCWYEASFNEKNDDDHDNNDDVDDDDNLNSKDRQDDVNRENDPDTEARPRTRVIGYPSSLRLGQVSLKQLNDEEMNKYINNKRS